MILSGRLMEYARQCVRDGVFDVLQEIVLAEFAKEIATLEARLEALEIEVATWRVLAGPIWMGDESEGHFVCLACNQPGADDGGCKTIQHLPDCEYAAALAAKEEK